jgi:hypothetical protein
MSEQCSNCRFWHAERRDSYNGKAACRRFPPNRGTDSRESDLTFPRTLDRNWCGEHQALPPEPFAA